MAKARKFNAVRDMLKRAMQLDEQKAWFFVIDREAKEEIIRLNTWDQLYNDGIDANEISLGEYANSTKAYKLSVGERYDHVTLYDTGAFYESFKVVVHKNGFDIEADDEAFYDMPLTSIYGLDILGLTDENMGFLADWITTNYHEYIRQQILP